MDEISIVPGLSAELSIVVGTDDTAIAHGSGTVPVLATPRVVALVEAAAVAAVAPQLPAEATTVGSRIVLDHLAPSVVGSSVSAHAEVETVSGRRIVFRVWATMDDTVIARGDHVRVVVPAASFGR